MYKCSFDSQATWVIGVFYLFHDMLSMNVCATRHWHTSGRLVQELNVCIVQALCSEEIQRAGGGQCTRTPDYGGREG